MLGKDRAVILNKLYLLIMLPSLYQTHLENQLESSELLFLNILINVLQDIKEVSIEKLATNLPLPILFESRRKKLQRFRSLPTFNIKNLWLPIIENWLTQSFSSDKTIYLVIDRTNWSRNNLILLSLIYDKRAIPIYWELLPKLGSSSLAEQKRVFSQVLGLFKKYKVVVLGDREFCSVQLASWLREQEVEFCLRLKKSENIEVNSGIWLRLDNLGLKPGISLFLNNVKVTKTKKNAGFNLASKWKKRLHGCAPKEGWFILTNLTNLNDAINAYKQRFDIEEMLRDFKSGGYNMEATNAADNRLISLILIITFAYSLATFNGLKIKEKEYKSMSVESENMGELQEDIAVFILVYMVRIGLNS